MERDMKTPWISCMLWLIVIAGTVDVLSTDLRYEANPVLVAAGPSWQNLVILKVSLSLIALVTYVLGLKALDRRVCSLPDNKGHAEILSILIYRKQVPISKLLFGWPGCPSDWGALAAIVGIIVATSAVSIGFIAALTNTFNLVRSYQQLVLAQSLSTLIGAFSGIYLSCLYITRNQNTEQIDAEGPPIVGPRS
jgi:hypothetical protein